MQKLQMVGINSDGAFKVEVFLESQKHLEKSRLFLTLLTTPTPWLTLLLVLGKCRVNQIRAIQLIQRVSGGISVS
jgi:hypothetical protein